MSERRGVVAGSAAVHPPFARCLERVSADTPISASIILQRRPQEADIAKQLFSPTFQPLSQGEAASQLGADPSDVGAIEDFARQYGLEVVSSDAAMRTVKIDGSAADVERAFGVRLSWYEGEGGQRYISYDGELTVPESLAGAVMAITGLDSRPLARSRGSHSF